MLAQIAVSYVLVWLVDNYRQKTAGRIFFVLSVFFPFAALFYFKYFYFFAGTIFHMNVKEVPLPIGISFYTFQIVSYCADVYYRKVKKTEKFYYVCGICHALSAAGCRTDCQV